MKLMISGSRTATTPQDEEILRGEIAKLRPTHLLHGGARGADTIVKTYAQETNLPQTEILPDYNTYGNHAPHHRNDALLRQADAVLCYYAANYPERTAGTESVAIKARIQGKLIAEVWRDKRKSAIIQPTLF